MGRKSVKKESTTVKRDHCKKFICVYRAAEENM